jgi:NAD(P)-dependent dehydrogenase (short-subunit alcohol dehydrogenase family)
MAGALQGRVALVTGASRGIGAAIAERFAAEGASVAVTARSLDAHPDHLPGTLFEVADRIRKRGVRAATIGADLTEPSERPRIVREAEKALGPIDILVNNAAAAFYIPFERITPKRMRIAWELNVRAPFELAQLVVPGMRERGRGWIVNVSSATAMNPQGPPYPDFYRTGGATLYGLTKAALDRLTTGLAAELSGDGIAVNSLAPVAAVMTPGVAALGIVPDVPELVEPVELMAEAAVAVASGDPAVLTGRILYTKPLLDELGREVRAVDGSPWTDAR